MIMLKKILACFIRNPKIIN